MQKTYGYEELKGLGGHEIVAADGEKVGYIDLVFRDNDTGAPEWFGVWDGLPDTRPRVLVPAGELNVDDDVVRLPWTAETMRKAPSYEVPQDLVIGHDTVVEIDAETERRAYEHYGIEPAAARDEPIEVVQFRVWRIQSF
jgi:hypothetical protein